MLFGGEWPGDEASVRLIRGFAECTEINAGWMGRVGMPYSPPFLILKVKHPIINGTACLKQHESLHFTYFASCTSHIHTRNAACQYAIDAICSLISATNP